MRAKVKVSSLRVAFQVLLHLVLIGHVLAWYFLDWRQIGALDFQAFYHDFLSRGVLSAGALLTAAALGATLIFGRLFCGWGCHFGATQDFAAWVLRRLRWRPPHLRTRFLHWAPYALLAAIFLAPALESWQRRGGPPALRLEIAANAPWAALPGWIGSALTFLACGAGILLFLGRRGFCRFVCPYGAVFRLLDPLAPARVRKVGLCSERAGSPCGTPAPCTLACPTAIDVHVETAALGAVRDRDCVRCHLCIEACPSQALAYGFRSLPVLGSTAAPLEAREPAPRFTLGLGAELWVALVAIVAYLAWDRILAAHFLAAALALGEGFLALAAARALSRRTASGTGTLALRKSGRLAPAGAAAIGAFLLSLVPLAQCGAAKALVAAGDHALATGAPVEASERLALAFLAAAGDEEPESDGKPRAATDKLAVPAAARGAWESARRAYEQAWSLWPHDPSIRRRLALSLAVLGDAGAAQWAPALEESDSAQDRALGAWIRARAAAPPR